jgi:hypothetical protein
MAVAWMRARIEGAGHEGDAMDTICAFDKEAEVLYHVPLVRVVPPKILLDGGDELMNDARDKRFARCGVLCHSRAPARGGSAPCRPQSTMRTGEDVSKEQRPPSKVAVFTLHDPNGGHSVWALVAYQRDV